MDHAIRMKDVEQLFLDDPPADAVLARTQSADVAVLLPSIKLRHAERITGELVVPARDAVYAEFPADLEPRADPDLLAASLRVLKKRVAQGHLWIRTLSPASSSQRLHRLRHPDRRTRAPRLPRLGPMERHVVCGAEPLQ